MLGIKLEIDKQDIKDVENSVSEPIKTSKKEKTSKGSVAKSAGIGGAIGGLIGSLLGTLKPVKEFLGVIAGIMEVLLVPILNILKPFLVLFLKIGMGLYKWLQDSGFIDAINKVSDGIEKGGLKGGVDVLGDIIKSNSEDGGISGLRKIMLIVGTILLGIAIAMAVFFLGIPGLILVAITAIVTALYLAWDYLKAAWNWIVQGVVELGNWFSEVWSAFVTWLQSAGEWFKEIFVALGEWFMGVGKWLGEMIMAGFGFLKSVGADIWNFIFRGLQFISDLGLKIWNFFLSGLKFISDLGVKLWDWFKGALSSIGDLGSKIWSYIKSAMSSLVGGGGSKKTTSANDALITSDGSIIKFNPNDNIIAFQDFSTLGNFSKEGSSSGQNITINVQGFVGDEQELADKIGKALKNSSRGGISNY